MMERMRRQDPDSTTSGSDQWIELVDKIRTELQDFDGDRIDQDSCEYIAERLAAALIDATAQRVNDSRANPQT